MVLSTLGIVSWRHHHQRISSETEHGRTWTNEGNIEKLQLMDQLRSLVQFAFKPD